MVKRCRGIALGSTEGSEEAPQADGRHREVSAVEPRTPRIHILYFGAVGTGMISREGDGEIPQGLECRAHIYRTGLGEDAWGEMLRRHQEISPLGEPVDEVGVTQAKGKGQPWRKHSTRTPLPSHGTYRGEEASEDHAPRVPIGQRQILHHQEGIDEPVKSLLPPRLRARAGALLLGGGERG